jgi:ADP-ribosylglycohydrolase
MPGCIGPMVLAVPNGPLPDAQQLCTVAPMKTPDQARAVASLEGLALGDAFGERFFVGDDAVAANLIAERRLPGGPWRWTDDTAMAIPIVEALIRSGAIDPDLLAKAFSRRYSADPARGYGRGTHQVLGAIASGTPWTRANRVGFHDGSRGNGSAMRSAPVGAYFAGQIDQVVDGARASSVPTHVHPDGIAGAIAIAVAAHHAGTEGAARHRHGDLLTVVLAATPPGPVSDGLRLASQLGNETPIGAAAILGSGQHVLAADTVPFAIWCADRHLGSFEEALWAAVAGLGDRDTTCAMVGGIVALSDPSGLPPAWLERREALPKLDEHRG